MTDSYRQRSVLPKVAVTYSCTTTTAKESRPKVRLATVGNNHFGLVVGSVDSIVDRQCESTGSLPLFAHHMSICSTRAIALSTIVRSQVFALIVCCFIHFSFQSCPLQHCTLRELDLQT